ncbi:hypothetical protein [Burkholderia sp. S171]|uniref:hypothetical protein n=1 Tax=Burkholderia sp. S171 TaxID=1641860 RepID=UPI00131E0611|nr:hypothetical protein [Burkholderia sp. S171]
MARYGIIVTEKVEPEDHYIHWLLRGTVVRLFGEGEVECVAPCYGVPFAQFQFRKHRQFLNDEDVIEIAADQLEALRAIAD